MFLGKSIEGLEMKSWVSVLEHSSTEPHPCGQRVQIVIF